MTFQQLIEIIGESVEERCAEILLEDEDGTVYEVTGACIESRRKGPKRMVKLVLRMGDSLPEKWE